MSVSAQHVRSLLTGALLCCFPISSIIGFSCSMVSTKSSNPNSYFRYAVFASFSLAVVSLIQSIFMIVKLRRSLHRILIIGLSPVAFADVPRRVVNIFLGLLLCQIGILIITLYYFWKACMSPIFDEALQASEGYFRLRALSLYAGLLVAAVFASTRLMPLLDRIRGAFTPTLKRLVIDRHGGKRELDICYITSRIVVVSRPSLSNPETAYLEAQYSNFLKHLPAPLDGQMVPLSTISTIVETAVQHLFSNPVNVVSINTPEGDANSILIVCALLLRTGAVHPPTAENAVNFFARQRYTFAPSVTSLIPHLLLSQLRIFETIMTKAASKDFALQSPMMLKRVSLSHFDSEKYSDIRLSVVDIDSGRVLADTLTPSVSTHGLTFICSPVVSADTIFVFKERSSDSPLFKLYMHSGFHLQRAVASTSVYHYLSNTDACDHWSGRTRTLSARIEIVATPAEELNESKNRNHDIIDRDLLALPRTYAPVAASGCFIV